MSALGSPTGKTADGVAREVQGQDLPGASLAQVVMNAALDDAEEPLVAPLLGGEAPRGPARGACGRFVHRLPGGGIGRAFVERHDDVRAEVLLDLDRTLGREEVRRAVEVALETHALLAEVAQAGEAEDLVAAAVGEEGTVPAREAVEAPEVRDQSRRRAAASDGRCSRG